MIRLNLFGLWLWCLLATASNLPAVNQLVQQSMLHQARQIRQTLSADAKIWQHTYMTPAIDHILTHHSVWFDAYPDAMVHEKGDTVLTFLANERLWGALQDIGVTAMHTGPMQLAGGYQAGKQTPSVDGGFDPVSLHIDPKYGSDEQYKILSKVAKRFGGIIISDLIPGHTGKGIDFYLALLGLSDYQGLYTIIEIPAAFWPGLPKVATAWQSQNLSIEQVEHLSQNAILPGHLQRVMFSAASGKKTTGWDVTGIIKGIDGKSRRYAYLHYFKPGQPTLNWLDASFSAHQLIGAHIIHAIVLLQARMLRIDANPFLGLERIEGTTKTRSEGTPLAINASNTIAQMIRKFGGYSFQELNLSLGKLKQFMQDGADFSYDFITRPAVEHALLTGDARLLNTMLQLAIDKQIDMRRLEHGLQNHDEITYELVEFLENPSVYYRFGDQSLSGQAIRGLVLSQLQKTISSKPYHQLNQNGLCTTLAGLVANRFDLDDPYHASPAQISQIQKGMQLIFAFNALLPGVVNLSGWDLVGALPMTVTNESPYLEDGDCRWLNRGAYQLMQQHQPTSRLPKASALFADLTQQMKQPTSFAQQVKSILAFRQQHQLAKARLVQSLFHQRALVGLVTKTRLRAWLFIFNFSDKPQQLPPLIMNQYRKCAYNRDAVTLSQPKQHWQIKALSFAVFQGVR